MGTKRTAVVVGAGAISGAWFPALAEEDVEVLAVVDLNEDAARSRIGEYGLGANAFSSLTAAFSVHSPDFVVDLTVPEAHHDVAVAAMRAGCHVIGEKPMASSMREAQEMVQASEETGRLFMVSQSRRWTPEFEQLRATVQSGAIGGTTTINCDFYIGAHFGGFRDAMDHVLLLDMAIHHFDLARYISGADPVAVYAREFNPKGSWYRHGASAACVFEMTNGVVFSYRGSWCSEGCHTSWNGDWRVVGECGTLLCASDAPPTGQAIAGTEGFHRPLRDVPIPDSSLRRTGMHAALAELLEWMDGGPVPQTECHDNIKSLEMVFAAIESARTGARVPMGERQHD